MTSPSRALVDAILAADHPMDAAEQLLAADAATVQAVLDVLDTERQETLRLRAAWEGVRLEAGPYFTEKDDTLGAVVARMPEPGRARALEHLRVLEEAGVVRSGRGL
ncbi:hypothetical protein ACIQK6_13625 [Streptomyces sp. NPDC091682]|uniref:hypothetical protein n=1 Tax=Streptomyces sp. NPDC091682 TaxID=3366005 RepID=UPI003811CB3E